MGWKKYIIMAFVGVLISIIIDIAIPFEHPNHNRLYDYLFSIIISITVWEGNLIIDRLFGKKLSWITHTFKRTVIQLPINVLYSVVLIYSGMWIYNNFICVLPPQMAETLFFISTIVGTLFSIILLAVEISYNFLQQWKNSLIEVEKYKTLSLQAQLQNLKNQVNPHFLFNNLSVLSSLVYKDQDKAVSFISQLSKVYRYLLDNNNQELICLKDEIEFINSYLFLLKIRFDESVNFKININDSALKKMIPPMALQILIENTIKHNESSVERPLNVEIIGTDEYLEVRNNLQLRSNEIESSGTGLSNINKRYKFYTSAEIEIYKDATTFSVKIPLLALYESNNN